MKSLSLDGKISSSGFPQNPEILQSFAVDGGSGGHISIILSKSTETGMKIGDNAIIQAIGGYGVNDGQSGSGGRIVINNQKLNSKIINQIEVHGGDLFNYIDDVYCHFGAAGTIYFNMSDTLYVKNKFRNPRPQLRYRRQETPLRSFANTTNIISEATITVIPFGAISKVIFRNLQILDNSVMIEPVTPTIFSTYNIYGENLTILNNSAFITGNVSKNAYIELSGQLIVGLTSKILYESQISIFTEGSMQVFGDLEQLSSNPNQQNADLQLILRSNKDMYISSLFSAY